jgi:hypothetical protein
MPLPVPINELIRAKDRIENFCHRKRSKFPVVDLCEPCISRETNGFGKVAWFLLSTSVRGLSEQGGCHEERTPKE